MTSTKGTEGINIICANPCDQCLRSCDSCNSWPPPLPQADKIRVIRAIRGKIKFFEDTEYTKVCTMVTENSICEFRVIRGCYSCYSCNSWPPPLPQADKIRVISVIRGCYSCYSCNSWPPSAEGSQNPCNPCNPWLPPCRRQSSRSYPPLFHPPPPDPAASKYHPG